MDHNEAGVVRSARPEGENSDGYFHFFVNIFANYCLQRHFHQKFRFSDAG